MDGALSVIRNGSSGDDCPGDDGYAWESCDFCDLPIVAFDWWVIEVL